MNQDPEKTPPPDTRRTRRAGSPTGPHLQTRIERQFRSRHESFDRASRWAGYRDLLEVFVAALDARHHQVLEACCGTGKVGEALTARGAYVVGVDLSPHMLSLAGSRLAEAIQANVERLPFPEGSFERLVLRQAWHFFDPRVASRELARVATPGALLVTGQIVPFGPEDAEYQEIIHRAKQPDLVWFPTEDALIRQLAEAGWEVTASTELLIEEEMGAWLKWAPETGDRADAVVKLVREAPECYRGPHRVREDPSGLWDTFRWIIIRARRPGASPRVSPALLEILRCPHCRAAPLEDREDTLACASCAAVYPVDAGVPRFRNSGDP